MKPSYTVSPKTAWLWTKRAFVTAAVIPSLALSSWGAALTPVAHAATDVCLDQDTTTITLMSGPDTQTAGFTTTNPEGTPTSPTAYGDASFGGASETNAVIPPWVDPATETDLSGAVWISSDTSNNEGNSADDQWRLFEDSFTLPAGALVSSADLFYSADNAVQTYLNGGELDGTGDVFNTPGDPTVQNYAEVFNTSFEPQAGDNTLDFVVRNWAHDSDNPTGLIYKATVTYCVPPTPDHVTVTIEKYIDGEDATAENTNSASFPMTATWSDLAEGGIGAGTGTYALSTTGFNNPDPYKATTANMQPGADYSTSELLDGDMVGATCDDGKPFMLAGYTTGDTLEAAEGAEPSMTLPAFTDLMNDKYVVVWNNTCNPETPDHVKVTIDKFVQGQMATASSSNSADFTMNAAWNAGNIGAGSGQFTLGANGFGGDPTPYHAVTVDMDPGADYSTNEVLTGDVTGATCDDGKPFALQGYTTGNTFTQAAAGTPSMTLPAFTNLQNDKYVIVWNHDCSQSGGEIGGDVGDNGALAVTSIDSVDTSATADGTFADGWKYIFHITTPNNEQDLAMKFSDWLRTGGGGTIPVANNMRISSAQANNGGATITLTAANTYSTPALHMVTDLDPGTPGRQVQVTVEVAVPSGTPDGSYTTNYGVQTTP